MCLAVGSVGIISGKASAAGPNSVLAEAGYDTFLFPDWEEAIAQLEGKPVALILVTLAPQKGLLQELAGRLRQVRSLNIASGRDVPALAIFPDDVSDPDVVPRSLNDFIVEPYHPDELLSRVERLLGPAAPAGRNLIISGDLVIDLDQYTVSVAGRPVCLTFKEFQLLKFLASQPGKVFNREVLLNEVWGYDFFGGGRTVDVHVRHLRSKLEDKDHAFVRTVRNIGYRFEG
ncbi:MAG: response regulator transcription factor [Chloroflexi bacterium]|nr:response regulator transcription factor [Chloroflexota bacterium]